MLFGFHEQNGTLDKYNVELLGAKLPSINRAEDRNLFKQAMTKIGLKTPQSGIANTMEEALQVQTLPGPPAAQSWCLLYHRLCMLPAHVCAGILLDHEYACNHLKTVQASVTRCSSDPAGA